LPAATFFAPLAMNAPPSPSCVSAAPFSVGWWAVASEAYIAEIIDGKPTLIPRGALVRYREWYGAKKDASGKTIPNVGLKMKNEDIGAGIKEHETRLIRDDDGKERFIREAITCGVLDPRCFANEGGTPIAEAIFKGGAMFRQADNARVREFGAASGWGQVRGRLIGNDDGHSMIFCFSTCVDSIRTIPFLQHDPARARTSTHQQRTTLRMTGATPATRGPG
jgi:hypothetical protein